MSRVYGLAIEKGFIGDGFPWDIRFYAKPLYSPKQVEVGIEQCSSKEEYNNRRIIQVTSFSEPIQIDKLVGKVQEASKKVGKNLTLEVEIKS